jgi:hypothetical protein
MQLNGKILLLVAVGVGVYVIQKQLENRPPAEEAPAAAPASPAAPVAAAAAAVRVRDRLGNPVQIDLADGAPAIVIGTWDPRSRALINALNDPAMQPYLHGTTFTYLVERDEWGHVKQGLRDAQRGMMSEEQMDAQITARRAAAGNSGQYDEGVIDHVLRTGGTVYYFDRTDGITVGGYPRFHTSGSTFTTDPGQWLSKHGVPADVASMLLNKNESAPR